MPYNYIDSSDEEYSETPTTDLDELSYQQHIVKSFINTVKIDDKNISFNSEVYLGIFIHYIADIITNNPSSFKSYSQLKYKFLSPVAENYEATIAAIQTNFRPILAKELDSEFIDKLSDKDYITIFNYLFNVYTEITPKLKDSVQLLKNDLLNAITDINLKSLKSDSFMLSLEDYKKNPEILLIIPRLLNRINKNNLKYQTIDQNKTHTSTNQIILNNTTNNIITNTQTETSNIKFQQPDLESYSTIFTDLLKKDITTNQIADYIFKNINNNYDTAALPLLSKSIKHILNKLTVLLFVTETQRNNSTFITAPIFLEMIKADNKYFMAENFPMALSGAVNSVRQLLKSYPILQKNYLFIDYYNKSTKFELLLIKEGKIVIDWLKHSNLNLYNEMKYLNQLCIFLQCLNIFKDLRFDQISLLQLEQLVLKSVDIIEISTLVQPIKAYIASLITCFKKNKDDFFQMHKSILKKQQSLTQQDLNLIDEVFNYFEQNKNAFQNLYTNLILNFQNLMEINLVKIFQLFIDKFQEWYDVDVTHLFPQADLVANVDEPPCKIARVSEHSGVHNTLDTSTLLHLNGSIDEIDQL